MLLLRFACQQVHPNSQTGFPGHPGRGGFGSWNDDRFLFGIGVLRAKLSRSFRRKWSLSIAYYRRDVWIYYHLYFLLPGADC